MTGAGDQLQALRYGQQAPVAHAAERAASRLPPSAPPEFLLQ